MSTTKTRSRNPMCARCRNHGLLCAVKGHKRFCQYGNCPCDNCFLVVQKRQVSMSQIALRRRQALDEANGLSIPVKEEILNGNGGSLYFGANIHALWKKYPHVNVGRLHAVLVETGNRRQAEAKLREEDMKRPENNWPVACVPGAPSPTSSATAMVTRTAPLTSFKTEQMYSNEMYPCYYPRAAPYPIQHVYNQYNPFSKMTPQQGQTFPTYEDYVNQAPSQYCPAMPNQTFSCMSEFDYNPPNTTATAATPLKPVGAPFSCHEQEAAPKISPSHTVAMPNSFTHSSPSSASSDEETPLTIDC